MYVCVRVYSIFDIFSPAVWIFVSTFQRPHRFKSIVIFPFPFVDNAKVRHKKSPDN